MVYRGKAARRVILVGLLLEKAVEHILAVAERRKLTVDAETAVLIGLDCAVGYGVSGGKDSSVMVLEFNEFLDEVGHEGPRILIHSDLGRIEHRQSLPVCRKLAAHVRLPLEVVRRAKGDMVDRWLQRAADNLARYANLEIVTYVSPWSSAIWRFCTAELKVSIICRRLRELFPGMPILSVVGIRREESPGRAKKPASQINKKLSDAQGCWGRDLYPILDFKLEDVYLSHRRHGFPLHEAYGRGLSRVSCAFCVLSSAADLLASAQHPDTHDVYRELVALEIETTFSFQGNDKWLGDVRPELLTDEMRTALAGAKKRAERRRAAESRIQKEMLYEDGWPNFVPTIEQCAELAAVRVEVAEALGIEIKYTTGEEVLARYEELYAAKLEREARAARTRKGRERLAAKEAGLAAAAASAAEEFVAEETAPLFALIDEIAAAGAMPLALAEELRTQVAA